MDGRLRNTGNTSVQTPAVIGPGRNPGAASRVATQKPWRSLPYTPRKAGDWYAGAARVEQPDAEGGGALATARTSMRSTPRLTGKASSAV